LKDHDQSLEETINEIAKILAVSCFFFTEYNGDAAGPFGEIAYCISKETGDVTGPVLFRKRKEDPKLLLVLPLLRRRDPARWLGEDQPEVPHHRP
jgi:hypothetical protein